MNICKQLTILLTLFCLSITSYAIDVKQSTPRGDVTISYEIRNSSEVYILKAYNQTDVKIIIYVDGDKWYIDENESTSIGRVCKGKVTCESDNAHCTKSKTFPRVVVLEAKKVLPKQQEKFNEPELRIEQQSTKSVSTTANAPNTSKQDDKPTARSMTIEQLNESIDNDDYWGEYATSEFVKRCNEYIEILTKSANKKSYIEKSDVLKFVKGGHNLLDSLEAKLNTFVINKILNFCSQNRNISSDIQNQIQADIIKRLQNRLNQRKDILQELESEIAKSDDISTFTHGLDKTDIVNYSVIGIIVLLVLILSVRVMSKRSKKRKARDTATSQPQSISDVDNPSIVVRRKTTSILKKLYIDDVKDNSDYKKITSSDFCQDSAVRNIYIKNTCIKEIYDIYAEDLRNVDRPKEDGCMVLGRWILDEASHTYDVTLETVVLPGEDAIFKEYELNFGGKIKLRIAEKLRKLRKETNLQYDLTCWVHSHPGLGVFFSNSDSNVQMQLKHVQHPNFLIAFVIDILTDNQELGIFTFRHDGTINSKQDIIQMYSLEDLYKWAIESTKKSFSEENHYDVLHKAELKMDSCRGVELNNSAIIDLSRIAMESIETGLIGWAVGYPAANKKGNEFVISSIYKHGEQPSTGIMGCLISVTHMSLPTIQRMITNEHLSVSFVVVYSTRQMTLTTIPVIKGEIINDERYYSEETLENLKIWTRRKR